MSLLLEALKKAALEKQERKGGAAPGEHPPGEREAGSRHRDTGSAGRTEEESADAHGPGQAPRGTGEQIAEHVEERAEEPAEERRDFEAEPDSDEVILDLDEEFEVAEDTLFEPDDEEREEEPADRTPEVEPDPAPGPSPPDESAIEGTARGWAIATASDAAYATDPRQEEAARENAVPESEERGPTAPSGTEGDQLERLLENGREVARRTQRSARFLYTMLIVTAVGGILAYYFYLLASSRFPIAEQLEGKAESVDSALHSPPYPAAAETGLRVSVDEVESEELEVAGRRAESAAEVSASSTVAASSTTPDLRAPPPSAAPSERREELAASARATVDRGKTESRLGVAPESRAAEHDRASSASGHETESAGSGVNRITVQHDATGARLHALVRQAYTGYQSGDYDGSARAYGAALELAPDDRDSLLGAAAVAALQHRWVDAMSLYQRRLRDDPHDQYAIAGMIALARADVPAREMESRVARLLEKYPQAAHLHFLMGSLSASAGRWAKAGDSFLKAFRLEPTNADYAYNLAVSFDQRGESARAAEFYRRALRLSAAHPFAFSIAQVEERLRTLDDRVND